MSKGQKPKRGRPTDDQKKEALNARVPTRLILRLDQIGQQRNLNRSALVRQLLEDKIDGVTNSQAIHSEKELILFRQSSLTWTGLFKTQNQDTHERLIIISKKAGITSRYGESAFKLDIEDTSFDSFINPDHIDELRQVEPISVLCSSWYPACQRVLNILSKRGVSFLIQERTYSAEQIKAIQSGTGYDFVFISDPPMHLTRHEAVQSYIRMFEVCRDNNLFLYKKLGASDQNKIHVLGHGIGLYSYVTHKLLQSEFCNAQLCSIDPDTPWAEIADGSFVIKVPDFPPYPAALFKRVMQLDYPISLYVSAAFYHQNPAATSAFNNAFIAAWNMVCHQIEMDSFYQ